MSEFLEGLDRRERSLGDDPGRVDLAVTHVVVLLRGCVGRVEGGRGDGEEFTGACRFISRVSASSSGQI